MDRRQLIVSVRPDGTVGAETRNIYGDECLDFITVLEDLLDAETQSSSYTEDHARSRTEIHTAVRNDHTSS